MSEHSDRYNGMEELLGTNLAEDGTDCISRRKLLDKFEPWLEVHDYNDGERNVIKAVLYEIKCMPPATDNNVATRDCISRQAAIDVCDNVIDLFRGQFGAGVVVAIKESIEELPSAQPATDTNVGTKLVIDPHKIERAIRGLTEWQKHVQTESDIDRDISVAVEALKAQLGTNLAEVGTDLISRKQAIDAVTDELDMIDHVPQWVFDRLENRIKQLPSAQPEIIRCKDCKFNPKYKWFGCPMSHLSGKQRPETAWCWKAERRTDE